MRCVSLFLLLFRRPLRRRTPSAAACSTRPIGGCHYERVHDRLRSEVKDLSDLRDMVARWAPQTKRSFTLDEREDITQYLNESHYRIGLPPKRKP